MSITYKILGRPGKDNGLFLWINSGTSFSRILFDCGEDLLKDIEQHDIKSIDHLFLSHLHIDHMAGFDYLFRRIYERETKPIQIWGPEGTAEIIHSRLRGFIWNLLGEPGSIWLVTEINKNNLHTFRFNSSEGFKNKYEVKEIYYNGIILETESYLANAAILNHKIDSIGYRISEKTSYNIDKLELKRSGLPEGSWLETIKDLSIDASNKIKINQDEYSIEHLRKLLLVPKPGEDISYLTDFIYDEISIQNGIELINNCQTVICESQYSETDKELAKKNFHLTATQTAHLAKKANVKKLILFHISDRYRINEYPQILNEAKNIFPQTYFPEDW